MILTLSILVTFVRRKVAGKAILLKPVLPCGFYILQKEIASLTMLLDLIIFYKFQPRCTGMASLI